MIKDFLEDINEFFYFSTCSSVYFWAFLLNEDDIRGAFPRMMVTDICWKMQDVRRGSLVALEMRRPISVKLEHPADPMIPDVSTATGTNSKSATSWEYFRLFKSSAAIDVETGFKMVEHRLLTENVSAQMASQANALPPLKGNDVTPSGLLPSPRSRPTGSRMKWRPAVPRDILMMLQIAACEDIDQHTLIWL